MKKCCSTTVFLSLVFVLVSTLIFGLLESARTAGVRFYLQAAVDSAIDSLFSEYQRSVWEEYRLILLECGKEEGAVKSIDKYLKPYVENSGGYKLKKPSASIIDIQYATDNGGRWFENEVLDYMKYNLIDFKHTPDTSKQLIKEIEEAGSMKEITTAYGDHSKEAAALEKAISKISENFSTQKALYEEALEDIKNKNRAGFEDKIRAIKKEIKKLDSQLRSYQKKAADLSDNLTATEAEYADKWEKLSENNKNLLSENIRAYRTYTDNDGERRVEIEQKTSLAKDNVFYLDGTEDILYRITEREDEDDYDEEEADFLWSELENQWRAFEIPAIESRHGLADERKEKLIETAGEKFGGEILELVIPADRVLSRTELNTSSFPSKTSVTQRAGESLSVLEAMILDEYAVRFFTGFTDKSEKELQYELEYIIAGLDNDASNLRSVLLGILAVREGLNYMHIITDEKKMEQVKNLSQIISGMLSVPALTGIIACLIIGVWALAESVLDIRALLEGKKIPIYKAEKDWKLSLDGLLSSGEGSGGSTEPPLLKKPEEGGDEDKDSENGLDYKAYLRLMLLTEDNQLQDYRMMDMIQHNMNYKDKGFLMNKMVYGMNISVQCESERLFSRLGLVKNEFIGLSSSYELGVNALKAY